MGTEHRICRKLSVNRSKSNDTSHVQEFAEAILQQMAYVPQEDPTSISQAELVELSA